jgi:DNA-binding HxlR family transcriptional regulator
MAPDTPRPGRPVRGPATGRPVMALFDLIGRRWTLRVIWELEQAGKPLTFRELRAACGDVSSSVLTRRLHELTETLIIRRASAGYALTPAGHALVSGLEPVLAWARDWSRALATAGAPVPPDLDNHHSERPVLTASRNHSVRGRTASNVS